MDIPVFVWYIVGALVLTRVPYVGVFVRLLATLVHEIGHVLVSAVTGGSNYKIRIFSNLEGEAESLRVGGFKSGVGAFLTALAGYPFTAFVGLGFVYMIYLGWAEWVLITCLAMCLVSLVLWVRNWFGFFWVLTFGAVVFGVLFIGEGNVVIIDHVAMFITAVLVVDALVDALIILKLSVTSKESSGDCYALYKRTYIHPTVWGILFVSVSLFALVLGTSYWI